MNQQPDNSHYVRRVVLPSGRAIEVVYFDNDAAANPFEAVAASAPSVENLHICPECEQSLVFPTEWEEASDTHWNVCLRCPNCEWRAAGTYPQDAVDRFDEHLDQGTEALIRDLKRLTRANMEEEVDRFLRALQADAILPEDF